MKRKLIEISQENLIECDNPKCDYVVINQTKDPNIDVSEYINKSCPKCGENLLTEKDYKTGLKVLKIVNNINKWFSWIMIFVPKNSKKYKTSVKCHDGINIKLN